MIIFFSNRDNRISDKAMSDIINNLAASNLNEFVSLDLSENKVNHLHIYIYLQYVPPAILWLSVSIRLFYFMLFYLPLANFVQVGFGAISALVNFMNKINSIQT